MSLKLSEVIARCQELMQIYGDIELYLQEPYKYKEIYLISSIEPTLVSYIEGIGELIEVEEDSFKLWCDFYKYVHDPDNEELVNLYLSQREQIAIAGAAFNKDAARNKEDAVNKFKNYKKNK